MILIKLDEWLEGEGDGRHRRVKLQCFCGKEFIVYKTNYTSGRTKSCGCLKGLQKAQREKEFAEKIRTEGVPTKGKPTCVLVEPTGTNSSGYRTATFLCTYCGSMFEAEVRHVSSGHTKSCGCVRYELKMESERNRKFRQYSRALRDTHSFKIWADLYEDSEWSCYYHMIKAVWKAPSDNYYLSKRDEALPHSETNSHWVRKIPPKRKKQ